MRSAVRSIDRFQRRHPVIGFPLAVIYKYFEDQGPYLAAPGDELFEKSAPDYAGTSGHQGGHDRSAARTTDQKFATYFHPEAIVMAAANHMAHSST